MAHGAGAPLVTLRPPDVCKLRIFVCVAGCRLYYYKRTTWHGQSRGFMYRQLCASGFAQVEVWPFVVR